MPSTTSAPPNDAKHRTELLHKGWVHALALALAVILAFGSNIDGELVWDDDRVIGAAARLPDVLSVFRSNLFGSAPGVGAVYYRPLVALTYWIDVRIFATAPHVGMHLGNLGWQVLASVLALRTLRRWLGATDATPGLGAACFVACLVWSVAPQRAESVAWITGRGDVMGVVIALGGLELAARASSPVRRAVIAAATAGLAMLTKEAMVAVPALFIAESLCATRTKSRWMDDVRRAFVDPTVLASLGVAATYLGARHAFMPITSGGDANFAAISRVDKLLLFLESTGTATVASLTPWRSVLLREPIAFAGSDHLVHDRGRAILGAATWAAAAVAFVRFPRARGPIVLGLGTFLPASNLVLTGLEARLSERFLYLPSLGIAWGLALAFLDRRVAAVGAVAALVLAFRTSGRAALFASDQVLFLWEVENGDGALSVFDNAAAATARAGRWREARDLNMRLVERYHALGFRGEGFGELVEAARCQVWATEDEHPPSLKGFENLARALLARAPGGTHVERDDGRFVALPTDSREAARYVAKHRSHLELSLARVLARTDRAPEAVAIAEASVATCKTCAVVLVPATEVAISARKPDLAATWLTAIPPSDRKAATLERQTAAQRELLASGTPRGRALAAFIGGAYRSACVEGEAAVGGSDATTRFVVATSCRLAADAPRFQAMVAGNAELVQSINAIAPRLRADDAARLDLLAAPVP